jgi:succinylglutamate desuccinylase
LTTSLEAPKRAHSRERIIGRLVSRPPGPTLVAVGAIHGNEPAGAEALREVVRRVESERLLRRGELLALTGNVAALELGARFIDEDLNRHWSAARTERLAREGPAGVEDAERLDLFEALRRGFEAARGDVVLLDLHTTSGGGKPFVVFTDTLRSRGFARRFPVPVILGLEEQLEGTLVDYVSLLGHVALAFEGGQHGDPRSIAYHAALVWMALSELQMVDARDARVAEARDRLSEATAGAPGILEVTYRHAIAPGEGFRMRPGHASFEPVVRGQVIADDHRGEVAVPEDGFLLMPLYQKLGDDGFFVARRVRSFWLALSALLRRLRVGRFVHWLPGVTRMEGQPGAFRVDCAIARWYALDILHLLGFRRRSEEGGVLVVERRAHDPP